MTPEIHKRVATLLKRAEQCEILGAQNFHDLYKMQLLQSDLVGKRVQDLKIIIERLNEYVPYDSIQAEFDRGYYESHEDVVDEDKDEDNQIPITGVWDASHNEARDLGKKMRHIDGFLEDINKVITKALKYLLTSSNVHADIDEVVEKAWHDLGTPSSELDFVDALIAKVRIDLRTALIEFKDTTKVIDEPDDVTKLIEEVWQDLKSTSKDQNNFGKSDEAIRKGLKDLLTMETGRVKVTNVTAKVLKKLLKTPIPLSWLYKIIKFLISEYHDLIDVAKKSLPFFKPDKNAFQTRRVDIFNSQLRLLCACSVRDMNTLPSLGVKIESKATDQRLKLWEHILDSSDIGEYLMLLGSKIALNLHHGNILSIHKKASASAKPSELGLTNLHSEKRTHAETDDPAIARLQSGYIERINNFTHKLELKPEDNGQNPTIIDRSMSLCMGIVDFETRVHKLGTLIGHVANVESEKLRQECLKLSKDFRSPRDQLITRFPYAVFEQCMDGPLSSGSWAKLEGYLFEQLMRLRYECAKLYLDRYLHVHDWALRESEKDAEQGRRELKDKEQIEQKEQKEHKAQTEQDSKNREQKEQVNRTEQDAKTNSQHSQHIAQHYQQNVEHPKPGEKEVEEVEVGEKEIDPFQDRRLIYIHSQSSELLLNAEVIRICIKLCHLPSRIEHGKQLLPLTRRYAQVQANWKAAFPDEREAVETCLISIYTKNVLWHAYAFAHIYHSLLGAKGPSEDPEVRLSCTKVIFIHLVRLYQIIVERSWDRQHLPEYDRALLGILESPSEHVLMETPTSLSFVAVINKQSRIYFLKNDLHLLNRPIFYKLLGEPWIRLFGIREKMSRSKRRFPHWPELVNFYVRPANSSNDKVVPFQLFLISRILALSLHESDLLTVGPEVTAHTWLSRVDVLNKVDFSASLELLRRVRKDLERSSTGHEDAKLEKKQTTTEAQGKLEQDSSQKSRRGVLETLVQNDIEVTGRKDLVLFTTGIMCSILEFARVVMEDNMEQTDYGSETRILSVYLKKQLISHSDPFVWSSNEAHLGPKAQIACLMEQLISRLNHIKNTYEHENKQDMKTYFDEQFNSQFFYQRKMFNGEHPDHRSKFENEESYLLNIINWGLGFFCKVCIYIAHLALLELTIGIKHHDRPVSDPVSPNTLADEIQASAKRGFGISPDSVNIDLPEPDVSPEVRDSIVKPMTEQQETRWKDPEHMVVIDTWDFTNYIDGDSSDEHDGAPPDKGDVRLKKNRKRYDSDQRAGLTVIKDPLGHIKP